MPLQALPVRGCGGPSGHGVSGVGCAFLSEQGEGGARTSVSCVVVLMAFIMDEKSVKWHVFPSASAKRRGFGVLCGITGLLGLPLLPARFCQFVSVLLKDSV